MTATAPTLNLLDIDLDAFVDRIEHWKSGRRRLNKRYFKPWSQDDLRKFLKEQCGLSTRARIPGRFVIDHDEAYDYFATLLEGCNSPQLSVVHVDAHADLGMGDSSWKDIVTSYLHRPVEHRGDPNRGHNGLNPGSYLAYALANRWIDRLVYVHHPKGGNDCPDYYFRDNDPESGLIEMKSYSANTVQRALEMPRRLEAKDALQIEPAVPFEKISLPDFTHSRSFECAVLCQSPGFTPRTSDALIPVFKEFIDFDEVSQTALNSVNQ